MTDEEYLYNNQIMKWLNRVSYTLTSDSIIGLCHNNIILSQSNIQTGVRPGTIYQLDNAALKYMKDNGICKNYELFMDKYCTWRYGKNIHLDRLNYLMGEINSGNFTFVTHVDDLRGSEEFANILAQKISYGSHLCEVAGKYIYLYKNLVNVNSKDGISMTIYENKDKAYPYFFVQIDVSKPKNVTISTYLKILYLS